MGAGLNRYFKNGVLFFGLWIFVLFILFPKDSKKESAMDINATMINIYGKSDKRLKLYFVSTYRPRGNHLPSECLSKTLNWNTATKKPILKFGVVSVKGKDEYNITIPVYNIDLKSKCSYEFAGISVKIWRRYDDDLYADIPILTDVPIFTSQGDRSGCSSSPENRTKIIKTKKYFRIPDGEKVSCFTEEFEEKDLTTNFICRLSHREINSSVDEIRDQSIHFDIDVEEQLGEYFFNDKRLSQYNYRKGKMTKEDALLHLSKQGHFKEADRPIHISILEKLQNLKKLITGEDNE